MKTIMSFFLLILINVVAWAQNRDISYKDMYIRILDKKGYPISNIIIQSLNTGTTGITDRSGLFVFEDMYNMYNNDTLTIQLPKYGKTVIPVVGMDSIIVTVHSNRHYSYTDNNGYSVIIEKNRSGPRIILDVQTLLSNRYYNSLVELLNERVVWPNIQGNKMYYFSGRRMLTLNTPNEPLVVLNGKPIGLISDVNDNFNLYDIKTVEVLDGDIEKWGIQGAYSVILIKTK